MARYDLRVNGFARFAEADDPDKPLLYVLRDMGLTAAKYGCGLGQCGACTVLIDGEPRLACITLAASVAGRSIETIEGLAAGSRMSRLQRAFHERLGAQCGFCTPGMIMSAEGLLRRNPAPSDPDIRAALGGNLCRCTGYVKIIESVQSACAES
jgi:4-hydroxybenzoyl-CoA reductase subunit gamma